MDISTASKTVRVSLPASVAGDVGHLKKAMGSILDKLGCQACCSGHDIFLELQRDYMFAGNLSKASFSAGAARSFKHKDIAAVRVGLKPELAGKIDNVFEAIDRIAELTGHTACATGCDMFFNLEERFVLDEQLNLTEQVMSVG